VVELFEIPMLCLPDFRFVVLYSNGDVHRDLSMREVRMNRMAMFNILPSMA